MSAGELQNYAFVSKYARWIPEKKRRETQNAMSMQKNNVEIQIVNLL